MFAVMILGSKSAIRVRLFFRQKPGGLFIVNPMKSPRMKDQRRLDKLMHFKIHYVLTELLHSEAEARRATGEENISKLNIYFKKQITSCFMPHPYSCKTCLHEQSMAADL